MKNEELYSTPLAQCEGFMAEHKTNGDEREW